MLQRNKLMMLSMGLAIILILFGGLLIFNYQNMMNKGSILIGLIFILGAVFFLVKYLANRNSMRTFDMSILFMIVCLGFGLIFLLVPGSSENLFKGLIGILMMGMSIVKMETILHIKNENKKSTIILLLIAMIGSVVGLVVIINGGNIMKGLLFSLTLILFGFYDVFLSRFLSIQLEEPEAE